MLEKKHGDSEEFLIFSFKTVKIPNLLRWLTTYDLQNTDEFISL